MSRKLFRVQSSDGRGPYRPGFSHLWSSDHGPIVKPWWTEMGIPLSAAIAKIPSDMFSGCAFTSMEQLKRWFTESEREKLDAFGFAVVKFRPDKIIAETPSQVVFAQSYPLSGLPMHGRLTERLAA